MIRRPPTSTLFPYTTPSDLTGHFQAEGDVLHDRAPVQRRVLLEHHRHVASGTGHDLSVDCDPALCRPHQATDDVEQRRDRKSTRLNSSHANISYAVFCLKKK